MCLSKPDADVELQPSDLGYPSSLSIRYALGEWIEIQRWSLYTLTCTLVQLEGGPDVVLASQEKALLVHVIPRHRNEHGGNPATAFRFGSAAIADKSSNDDVGANWEGIRDTVCLVHGASTLAILRTDPDPDRNGTRDELTAPVGTFPVMFVVHGVGVVRHHAFTLFRHPLRHVKSQDAADACTRAALEDLVRMIRVILSGVLVYRSALDPRQPEPDLWICEPAGKRKKTWKWKPFPVDEAIWRKREELLEVIVPGRTSDLTARQVLTLFDYGQIPLCSRAGELVVLTYSRA